MFERRVRAPLVVLVVVVVTVDVSWRGRAGIPFPLCVSSPLYNGTFISKSTDLARTARDAAETGIVCRTYAALCLGLSLARVRPQINLIPPPQEKKKQKLFLCARLGAVALLVVVRRAY